QVRRGRIEDGIATQCGVPAERESGRTGNRVVCAQDDIERLSADIQRSEGLTDGCAVRGAIKRDRRGGGYGCVGRSDGGGDVEGELTAAQRRASGTKGTGIARGHFSPPGESGYTAIGVVAAEGEVGRARHRQARGA